MFSPTTGSVASMIGRDRSESIHPLLGSISVVPNTHRPIDPGPSICREPLQRRPSTSRERLSHCRRWALPRSCDCAWRTSTANTVGGDRGLPYELRGGDRHVSGLLPEAVTADPAHL